MPTRAQQLFELGQSVWLDFIRRGHLTSGDFARLVHQDGIVGVTSNPTIFQLAITESRDYDAAIQERLDRGLDGPALFESLAVEDIQRACDLLRAVYDATEGRDGRVSIEVSPRLAHDSDGSVEEGRRLNQAVARPNVMVKIPATDRGLTAISHLTAEGINVNVTLIFSLRRYQQVMDAWFTGLERRLARKQPIDTIHSVASFFVSRVDTKVDGAIDKRLAALPADSSERAELESLKGKAAVANAKLAYARFREVLQEPRYRALAAQGARLQRPLWASTSTKNPAYRDVMYVEELIGPDTVNTMPLQTLTAFNDHGVVESRIERDLADAQAIFRRLPQLEIPIHALIDELEGEGVATFAKSYDALIAALEAKRRELVSRGASA